MKKYDLTYKPFGDSAILIEWPTKIDEEIIQDIVSFESRISGALNVLDTIIAYNSLTIRYKDSIDAASQVSHLKELYGQKQEQKRQESRLWEVPVCYDLEFGLDLEEIAKSKNLSVEEVIQLHSDPTYLIYFLGFQPGFLYLGGLNKQIHMRRKANPRLRVAKGSVGIGGEQTGVYPQDSAGGWNLIGKSPINFFDAQKERPCFAKARDQIQFISVNLESYRQIEVEVKAGVYELKSKTL